MENEVTTVSGAISKPRQKDFLEEWKRRRKKEVEWFEEWRATDEYKKIIEDLKRQNAEKGLVAQSAR